MPGEYELTVGRISKNLGTAATAEALSASTLLVRSVVIQPEETNTSDYIHVGTLNAAGCTFPVKKDASLTLGGDADEGDGRIDLAKIFIKVGTNGDDVEALYVS